MRDGQEYPFVAEGKFCSISNYIWATSTVMGNFRINPDFRIENFCFKHEISLLYLFTRPYFCIKSSYLG